MTKESDIVHQVGACTVRREKQGYTVYQDGATHATSDSTYALDADGLSIAIARCNHLATGSVHVPDFRVENHGSVCLLKPVTQAAKDWVGDHLPDDAQWFGGGVAIEPRYLDAILSGIDDEGLTYA